MSFSNAVSAGLNVGQALTGPAARYFNERKTFPLQVQSLKASIESEKARAELFKAQAADVSILRQLWDKYVVGGGSGGDPATDQALGAALNATSHALTMFQPGGALSGLQSSMAGMQPPSQPGAEEALPAWQGPQQGPPQLSAGERAALATRSGLAAAGGGIATGVAALGHGIDAVGNTADDYIWTLLTGTPLSQSRAESRAERARTVLLKHLQDQQARMAPGPEWDPATNPLGIQQGWMARLLADPSAMARLSQPSMTPGNPAAEQLRQLSQLRSLQNLGLDTVDNPLGLINNTFQPSMDAVREFLQIQGPLQELQMYGPVPEMYGPMPRTFPP